MCYVLIYFCYIYQKLTGYHTNFYYCTALKLISWKINSLSSFTQLAIVPIILFFTFCFSPLFCFPLACNLYIYNSTVMEDRVKKRTLYIYTYKIYIYINLSFLCIALTCGTITNIKGPLFTFSILTFLHPSPFSLLHHHHHHHHQTSPWTSQAIP